MPFLFHASELDISLIAQLVKYLCFLNIDVLLQIKRFFLVKIKVSTWLNRMYW